MSLPAEKNKFHNEHRSLRYNRWVIVIALSVIAITALIVSFSQVLTADEITYSYRLDTAANDPGSDLFGLDSTAKPIETFSDVVNSQAFHYMHWHGRSLVTGIEQFFSGVSTPQVFYVINVLVLVATLLMTVRFAVGRRYQWSLWVWGITLAYFLFGTPGDAEILLSINLSCNYLWPTMMGLATLLLWRHYRSVAVKGNGQKLAGLILVGVICGWSHEGICVPLSAMLFFYYVFHRKEWRTLGFAVTVSYWVGTLILLAAPGNFFRGGYRMSWNVSGAITQRLIESVRSLMYSNLLWVLVLTLIIIAVVNRRFLVDFVKSNRYLLVLIVTGVVFAAMFFTVERTYFFVDLFILILMLRLLIAVANEYTILHQRIVPTCLITLICAAYIFIGRYQVLTNRQVQTSIDNYLASPDGLTVIPDRVFPSWLSKFVANRMYGTDDCVAKFIGKSDTKWLVRITPREMESLENGTLFTPENRIGTSSFYTVPGGLQYWSRETFDGASFEYVVAPPSLNDDVPTYRKLSHLLGLSNQSDRVSANYRVREVNSRYGTLTVIMAFNERKVLDIKQVGQP